MKDKFTFTSLPLSYPLNPIIYFVFVFPIIIILLTKIPYLFTIYLIFKFFTHVFDGEEGVEYPKEGEHSSNKYRRGFDMTVEDVRGWWNKINNGGFKSFIDTVFCGSQGNCCMDVTESRHDFIIRIDIPGMKKEEIKVNVDGYVVTASGNRVAPEEEGHTTMICEKSYGEFTKSVTLPKSAEMESIQAKYENGELFLVIRKKEECVIEKKELKID